jgi:hypothetical protein
MGKDITGDDIPNLVVSNRAGGINFGRNYRCGNEDGEGVESILLIRPGPQKRFKLGPARH